MRVLRAALASLLLAVALPGPGAGAEAIAPAEWQSYRSAFLDPSGRIVDDANGGISHSEGQGYGLLLAYLAGAQADFDAIWAFTRREMQLRDDGLVAWKWDPAADPHIVDLNNASDGDILIAYALAQAGADWQRPELTEAARAMVGTLGDAVLRPRDGGILLLPAEAGFGADARPDGPVVNPSYWVFEAFSTLATLDPATDWPAVERRGLDLVEQVALGARALPPEWLSLAARPKPAAGFRPEFGYNALRIPLYLLRAGYRDQAVLERLRDGMTAPGGGVALVDLTTGATTAVLADRGYRAIPALVSCAIDGRPLPPALRSFAPTNYYPSTLHLLALALARKEFPQCL